MTGPTATRSQAAGARASFRRPRLSHLAAAALGVAVLLMVGQLMKEPNFIERIEVQNPTRYDITVHVAGEADGWMTVGTSRRQGTSTFEEIYDQGDLWILRFTAQGEEGGELRLSKTKLERDEWRIEIPSSVAEQLQEAGAPFPP